MPSLIELRASYPDGLRTHMVDACPLAYSEAGRAQFAAMPGIQWVRDANAPNGRGFYRGAREAVDLVLDVLTRAKVAHVRQVAPIGIGDCGYHLHAGLREYQQDGVGWIVKQLINSGAALLADEMGLGKSAQALGALDSELRNDPIPRLIIAPAIVVPHWYDQIRKWARSEPDRWTILSYEKFRTASKGGSKRVPPLPEGIGGVIIDEVHYLSSPKSQRTKAVAAWLAGCDPRPLVVGLSGTPMLVRPRDLHAPLDILWPGRFGKWWAFTKRYCDGHYEEIPHIDRRVWISDGASRVDELATRLAACMLRRTKGEVALELPPRTRQMIEVPIPKKALKDLQRAAGAVDLSGGAVLGASISSLLSNVETYKIQAALDLVAEITATGGRVLVLTTRKATAHELGEKLAAPVVTGDVSPGDRVVRLQVPVGVATMYSVTTGIDLVGFDHIVFTGLDWVPSTLLQAEARIHRIGQDKPCTIYYLIGQHTLDEVVRERVIERLDTFDQLAGGGGDEAGLASDLGGGSEDELIAALIAGIAA